MRLPVDVVLPEVVARLRECGAVVLRAATGAGKTTRVPPALLPHVSGQILVLEPRRVAARAAARRMADEHGSAVGELFGYSVRFDTRAGPRTRVLVATPGVLLRRLLDDPFLESVGCVVFDEFHERGVECDLLLGLVRLLRQTVRPDLRVVVMSATLDAGPVSEYLGGCPVVTSEGRTFPVDIRYRPGLSVAAGVREALAGEGDVLAFLPGVREIRQAESALADVPAAVLPLYGDLPPEKQDRALKKLDRRKVVLATNVAETSVTVEGVTAVVDTGTARQQQFDPGLGMDRLVLGPVSRASADQRAGRAGRTAPGVCLRLWDELGHRARPALTEPEVRRVDLAGPALHLLAFGESDLAGFPWLDAPRPEAVAAAGELLRALGLTSDSGLSPLGREVAALPVHPRVGRLLVEGGRLGVLDRAALAAAVLSDRDPFDRGGPARPTDSDVLSRVEAVEAVGRGGAYQLFQARDQFLRLLGERRGSTPPSDDAPLLRAIFAGWPDRLARRRGPGDRRARMVGGRGVILAPQSGVTDAELFVCVDVDAGGVESPVRQASAVRRDWLTTTSDIAVSFDPDAGKLVARKQTRFRDLVLDDSPAHIPDETEAARVLATAAAGRLGEALPPADSDAGRFLTRVRCLKGWLPDADLPAFNDAFLADLLEPLARSRRSLADLRAAPWLDALRGSLTYPQLQLVEREAPDRLTVPSGSSITLTYEPGRPPVLAARIQELFGLAETPRVANGRVKVLLHLLAPNYRPQQVTDDLASFWANGYPLVRKELRGRYPKHSWPDDLTTAEAIRGPKRRSTA